MELSKGKFLFASAFIILQAMHVWYLSGSLVQEQRQDYYSLAFQGQKKSQEHDGTLCNSTTARTRTRTRTTNAGNEADYLNKVSNKPNITESEAPSVSHSTSPSDSAVVFQRLERQICRDTCCVKEGKRVIKPYQPDLVSDTAHPEVQDRIGIFETMQYLPEVYYHCGETNVKNLHHIHLTKEIVPCLQPGTIILVKTENLEKFFRDMYPLLDQTFVLFTINGDRSSPKGYLEYISDDKGSLILHWYASNCDFASEDAKKLSCVPIGFAHNNNQKDVIENVMAKIDGLTYLHGRPIFPRQIEDKRQGLALVAFTRNKKKAYRDRNKLHRHMCRNDRLWHKETVHCGKVDSIEALYEISLKTKFMISPHGYGLDCYRTWEALFLGMIPVVKASTLDSLYQGLPVLIVQQWSDVTPELLHHTWETFQHQRFDFHRMYLSYWQFELSKHRDNPYVAFEYSRTSA